MPPVHPRSHPHAWLHFEAPSRVSHPNDGGVASVALRQRLPPGDPRGNGRRFVEPQAVLGHILVAVVVLVIVQDDLNAALLAAVHNLVHHLHRCQALRKVGGRGREQKGRQRLA